MNGNPEEIHNAKAQDDDGDMDVGWDITSKDVERLRQFLTPTIHTLPNLEPVVQPYIPLGPVHDKDKIIREKEQNYDIPLNDSKLGGNYQDWLDSLSCGNSVEFAAVIKSLQEDGDNLIDFLLISNLEAMLRELLFSDEMQESDKKQGKKDLKTMAGVDIDILTMEQYLALSRENQAPGVVKPKIGGNVNFEIKSQFMRELRKDTFSKNKDKDNHDHIDQGPIPEMRPAEALTAIQTMAGHSQKWHDGITSRNIRSSNSKDGLAALVNKLDNLGRDMKKLKKSVRAIQVGCQICEGPYLDKDCPLNEEVKQVEEVRYGKFRRTTPFNGSNEGKFHVGPPGYYNKIDNRLPYAEMRQSLDKLLAKHQEESAWRSTEMEGWIKNLKENAEINMRNQDASLKNLETQIEQLTEELHSRKEKYEQAKVVTIENEGPSSPKKLKNLHGISFLSDS
ncbi:hypothetical protein Tco_1283354 [Tanacetum coccineum]